MVHAVESQREIMDVKFADSDLEDLEINPDARTHFPEAVVKSYRRKMRVIRDADDERDLRAMKSLHFEKLKASGSNGQDVYSVRLNDQWRLAFNILNTEPKHTIYVLAIVDYH